MGSKLTPAQVLLGLHLKELGFTDICYEFQFNPDRRWRADLAVPGDRLLFECDGGVFRGGHRRGNALAADYERQNWAVLHGWRLLRWTNRQVLTGEAREFLRGYINASHK